MGRVLPQTFYLERPDYVARRLLGKLLVRKHTSKLSNNSI